MSKNSNLKKRLSRPRNEDFEKLSPLMKRMNLGDFKFVNQLTLPGQYQRQTRFLSNWCNQLDEA